MENWTGEFMVLISFKLCLKKSLVGELEILVFLGSYHLYAVRVNEQTSLELPLINDLIISY